MRLVARIKVITHPRARLRDRQSGNPGRTTTSSLSSSSSASSSSASPRPVLSSSTGDTTPIRAIALGASTGGPGAIIEVLRVLPPGFNVPILLTLHIGERFGVALAEWLDAQTACHVATAEDGQLVSTVKGVAMAPPNCHLVVRSGRLHFTRDPERFSCRPSVDVLFESFAAEYCRAGAACLLTGMGRDGGAGLLAIRRAGGVTIAQDEATCIVYGMPREAVMLGGAEHVLPLDEIGPALVTTVSERSGQA